MNERSIYDIQALIASLKQGEDPSYLYFWGHQPCMDGFIAKSCLSQWYLAPFTVNKICYPSAEHYLMAQKALLFNDLKSFEEILAAHSPFEAEKLGKKIMGFNQKIWEQCRFDLLITGNYAKFSQNTPLYDFLINTNSKIIVEANPLDEIYGIGLSVDHPDSAHPLKWKGLNLLGFALMKVRDQFIR